MSASTLAGLADRLSLLRSLSNESARALSELAGLSPTHFGLIESGDRPDPKGSTIAALAGALGVDEGWLLTGRGLPPTAEQVRAAIKRARAQQAA